MKYTMCNSILLILITCSMYVRCYQTDESGSYSNNQNSGISALFLSGIPGKSTLIDFRIKNTPVLFSMGLLDQDFCVMSRDYTNININNEKSVTLKGTSILSNAISIAGKVNYSNKSQWRMIMFDSFNNNNTNTGWSFNKTTECGFYKILGGNCQTSNQEIEKEIINLPPHTMIKIEGLYHFIGNWDHNTGYLKVDLSRTNKSDPKVVWANRCKNTKSPIANVKLCNDIEICKIASPISVTFAHSETNFKLIFGSTLEGFPCDKSFGISDIRIYIR